MSQALAAAGLPATKANVSTAKGLVSGQGLSPSQAAGQIGLEDNPSMYGGALPTEHVQKQQALGESSQPKASSSPAKTTNTGLAAQNAGKGSGAGNPSMYG